MGSNAPIQTFLISELIEEIAMGPFGSNIKVDCFVDKGVPVFNGSNLTGFATNDDELRYVTEEKAKSLGRALASRGDVVVTHRGTLGQIAYIPNDSLYEHYIISQSQFRMRMNEKVLPAYLVYYFHTPLGQWKIMANKAQTGVPALGRPTSTFQKIKIELPDIETQEKAIRLLDSIQAAIKLNQQINDYLEQICQALFDEFDSDEANPFVAVSDVADVNPRRTIKKGEEALCVEMSDLSTSGSFPSGWRMKPYSGGMKFVNGDTVMARITPCLENGKTGYINFLDDNQTAFGSTEYIVLATKGVLPPEYFYYLARNREFVAYAAAHMNGSSGRQRVSGADIERYEVRMPIAAQLERFRQVAEPAMKTILANSLESRKLAELRDALLPRLMSGEIDVSQIGP